MGMRRNSGTVQECSPMLVNTINQIMTQGIPHGSGVVIYPVNADNTLPGVLKRRSSTTTNSGDLLTMPSDRRWATAWDIELYTELTPDFITLEGEEYLFEDMRQFWFHRRNASTGSNVIANPHPWVYSNEGHTITFMHNGNVSIALLEAFYQANLHLIDPEIEALRNPDPFGINIEMVDSGLIFAVLLINIKQAGWDIGSGIRATLQNENLWEYEAAPKGSIANFILSDGNDTYAYRGMVNSLDLLGYVYDDNMAVITSLLNENLQALGVDELLYMPATGEPVVISSFSGTSDVTISPSKLNPQVFPNPFNPVTNISFTLPARAYVALQIFNVKGQLMSVIEKDLPQGENSLVWDAQHAPSGVYLYRITAGDHSATGKMLLLK